MTAIAASSERERRVRFANIRQELLSPVTALVGYGELLLEEACRLELADLQPDLMRILNSSRELLELVGGLLEAPGVAAARPSADLGQVQASLRHDLRNPLNAIKGYAELMLEELDELGCAIRPDLEKLLVEVDRLLAEIDDIVDFSHGDGDEKEYDRTSGMLAKLVRSIQPVDMRDLRPHEVGRILVVDDNASNRDLLSRRLIRDGHEVIEADSGAKALRTLAGEDFDLILLDLMMPDINGFEVLQHLKSDDGLREIPVIMISGLRETDSVIRCIEAGAEDYLSKPFSPVLLRARIGACLERKRWHDREREYLARLEEEKAKSDALLQNILPAQIVTRLSGGEAVIADRADHVTILFCDLVEFTRLASRLPPAELVVRLNQIFSTFDALTQKLKVEKIKTIGDAYMAAAGMPDPRPDHAEVMMELALGMLEALEEINRASDVALQVRIGMHTGPVVAGVIGMHKFIYDVWGETVNIASRLEAYGLPNRVHVSEQTRRALEHSYEFEPRHSVRLKGIGRMKTFLLSGRKTPASATAPLAS